MSDATDQPPHLPPHLPPQPITAAHRRALERNITKFYAFKFLSDAQLWIPIWVAFLTLDRGISLAQIGVMEALFLVAVTLLEIPTGAIADRWGRSFSMMLGSIAFVVAITLFGLATSYVLMLAVFIFWSLVVTLSSGADSALLYDTLKALGRENNYVKHAGRGEAALWLGAGLATLIGAPVAAFTSMQFTVLIGVVPAAAAALVAWSMIEPPRSTDPSDAASSYLATVRAALRTVWRQPAVRQVLFFTAIIFAGLQAAVYLTQPLLLRHGVEIGVTFSLLQMPMLVAGIVGALVAFRVLARVGESKSFLVLLVAGIAAYTALALVDVLAAVGFLVLVGLMRSAALPITTGYINRRIPSGQRATVLSLQSLVVSMVAAPLVVGIGAMADNVSLSAAFGLTAVMLAVGGLLTGAWWAHAHRRERLPNAPTAAIGPATPPNPSLLVGLPPIADPTTPAAPDRSAPGADTDA